MVIITLLLDQSSLFYITHSDLSIAIECSNYDVNI
jgi:hypothetical protein